MKACCFSSSWNQSQAAYFTEDTDGSFRAQSPKTFQYQEHGVPGEKHLQITPSSGSFVWKKNQILALKQRESDSLALTYSV